MPNYGYGNYMQQGPANGSQTNQGYPATMQGGPQDMGQNQLGSQGMKSNTGSGYRNNSYGWSHECQY